MEESITFLERIQTYFNEEAVDVKTYSPLTLAFIGDGVFEIIIRTLLGCSGNRKNSDLHNKKSKIVNAKKQAELYEAIREDLTEEEFAWFKRGRNAKLHSVAKNATLADYKKATGLETLYGFLYLSGKEERILYLTKIGLERVGILDGI